MKITKIALLERPHGTINDNDAVPTVATPPSASGYQAEVSCRV
jgi:hypothetical protein